MIYNNRNKFDDNTYFIIPFILNSNKLFNKWFIKSKWITFGMNYQLELLYDVTIPKKQFDILKQLAEKEPNLYNIFVGEYIRLTFSIENNIINTNMCLIKKLGDKLVLNLDLIDKTSKFWD